jgi:hypothetical protein
LQAQRFVKAGRLLAKYGLAVTLAELRDCSRDKASRLVRTLLSRMAKASATDAK